VLVHGRRVGDNFLRRDQSCLCVLREDVRIVLTTINFGGWFESVEVLSLPPVTRMTFPLSFGISVFGSYL